MDNKSTAEFKANSITIQNSFFSNLENQLRDTIYSLAAVIPDPRFEEHLRIYMPDYVLLMHKRYLQQMIPTLYYPEKLSTKEMVGSTKFMGVEIVDNYQDNIVVAVKDGLINKIEPIILNLKW